MAAWTIGMVPSTVMSLMAQQEAASAPDLGPTTQVLLAVALGLVAGPVLALFQWRCLRQLLPNAWYWLPGNALGWAVGMPIVFQAVELASGQADVESVVAIVSVALLAAGAVVGAIHGAFLVLLRR
jgi:hypothetical protein